MPKREQEEEVTYDYEVIAQEEFAKWVSEYQTLDKELTAASKSLKQLRDQKKALYNHMLGWMHTHNIPFVTLPGGEYQFVRGWKEKTSTLNEKVILAALMERFDGDAEEAASITADIYNMRAITEVEVLKKEPVAKKRSTFRAAEEE